MAKLIPSILLALVAVQIQCVTSVEERALSIPVINPFNIPQTVESFKNFTIGIADELNQAGLKAISVGQEAVQNIEGFAKSIINNTINDIKDKVNETIESMKKGPFGGAIRAGQCIGPEITAAVQAGENAAGNITHCITDQVQAIYKPAADLVNAGKVALSLGSDFLNNVLGCFKNANSIVDIGAVLCAVGQITPVAGKIQQIITSLLTDIPSLQTAVSHTRDAIIRCPRERVADFVVTLGNIVSDFGRCASAAFSGQTASIASAPSNATVSSR